MNVPLWLSLVVVAYLLHNYTINFASLDVLLNGMTLPLVAFVIVVTWASTRRNIKV